VSRRVAIAAAADIACVLVFVALGLLAGWRFTGPWSVSLTTSLIGAVADYVLAAPTPTPKGEIATNNILAFVASKIAPILLAVLGVIFIGRASRGEVSKVLTSSAIALIGIAFIVGAGALFVFGANLVNIVFE